MGKNRFKNLFKALEEVSIVEVIRVAKKFPRYAEEEENKILMASMSRGEVKGILKSMQRDKSPGLDKWTVEFF